jgi:hypothetical protein
MKHLQEYIAENTWRGRNGRSSGRCFWRKT